MTKFNHRLDLFSSALPLSFISCVTTSSTVFPPKAKSGQSELLKKGEKKLVCLLVVQFFTVPLPEFDLRPFPVPSAIMEAKDKVTHDAQETQDQVEQAQDAPDVQVPAVALEEDQDPAETRDDPPAEGGADAAAPEDDVSEPPPSDPVASAPSPPSSSSSGGPSPSKKACKEQEESAPLPPVQSPPPPPSDDVAPFKIKWIMYEGKW